MTVILPSGQIADVHGKTVTIHTSVGQDIIVDESDLPLIWEYVWYALYNPLGFRYYAHTNGLQVRGVRKYAYLHRLLLGVTDSKLHVDHIDGDTLNNRRSNLRVASAAQNQMNRKPASGKRYKGTTHYPGRGPKGVDAWMVRIRAQKQEYYVGTFYSEESAARAYDEMAVKLHGKFARLNFPVAV